MTAQTKAYWVRQGKSFIKTYVTVFLAMYLAKVTTGIEEGQSLDLFNAAALGMSAQWGFIAVLRNLYKVMTEKVANERV